MTYLHRAAHALWQKKPFRWFLAAIFATFVGVGAGKAVKAMSGSVCVVDGQSMLPTYQPGARVYTAPISTSLQRGDIVLLDDGHAELALKRIVGMPGETVYLWRGYVFINRKMLREPYLPKHTYTFPSPDNGLAVFELGEEQYFVLGDNRLCSVDSRTYGPVERKQIKSRVHGSENKLRADFVAYTLPAHGKRTIRAL
ncbi:MAG TPA: signal peptidase I [Candidatus Binatia bacterium]|jgi:signal peptidase I|nr:signal peptidase I [Candidatus Binatia bacterium]